MGESSQLQYDKSWRTVLRAARVPAARGPAGTCHCSRFAGCPSDACVGETRAPASHTHRRRTSPTHAADARREASLVAATPRTTLRARTRPRDLACLRACPGHRRRCQAHRRAAHHRRTPRRPLWSPRTLCSQRACTHTRYFAYLRACCGPSLPLPRVIIRTRAGS